MFQRPRGCATRRANERSGVITATRFSGTSSASRTSKAIACASSSLVALSISRTPESRRFAASRSIHARLACGGQNSEEIAWLRAEVGRASGRERVGQYGYISVGDVAYKK